MTVSKTTMCFRVAIVLLCHIFTAAPSIAAPLTAKNSAWNVNRNPTASSPKEYFGEWPGHTYTPSPPDWRTIGIYHLVTDRFSDGNPLNNDGRYGGYDITRVDRRHGGDFRGLKNKLDYIKGLGINSIWISPIFQNGWNSYHGYGQLDFTLLDERFGTLAELRELVQAAHERGMYVIVDIVVNHLANLYYSEGHKNDAAPFRMHSDEYRLIPRNHKETYADFSVNNTFIPTGNYCSVYSRFGERVDDTSGTGSHWESDLHHNGDLQDFLDPWQIHFGRIYGLYDDLRLCSPRVQDKIIAMTKSLIASTDIDGIRVDTPMQVPLEFLKRWAPEVRRFAGSLGKSNFLIAGETFCGRTRLATMIGRGKSASQQGSDGTIDERYVFDGGINYPLFLNFIASALEFETNPSFSRLLDLYQQDFESYDLVVPSSGKAENRMLNFFGSHDQWRLASFRDGEKKVDLAAALIALWPGIPVFYAGDEQALCTFGRGLEGHARESMMSSVAWSTERSCLTPVETNRDHFDQANPHYNWVARVMDLRRRLPSIATGELRVVYRSSDTVPGALAFLRGAGEGSVLVLMNMSDQRSEVPPGIPVDWKAGTTVRELLQNDTVHKISKSETFPAMTLEPWQVLAFTEAKIAPNRPLFVRAVTPQHDAFIPPGKVDFRLSIAGIINNSELQKTFRINDRFVETIETKIHSGTTEVTFSSELAEGIHYLSIEPLSRSSSTFLAPFRSRIRVGTPKRVYSDALLKTDWSLVAGGERVFDVGRRTFTIDLTEPGSTFYRFSTTGGKTWSDWTKDPRVAITFSPDYGWKGLEVQYWIDGSGAYRKTTGADFLAPLPHYHRE